MSEIKRTDKIDFECHECGFNFEVKNHRDLDDCIVCEECAQVHYLSDDTDDEGNFFWYASNSEPMDYKFYKAALKQAKIDAVREFSERLSLSGDFSEEDSMRIALRAGVFAKQLKGQSND